MRAATRWSPPAGRARPSVLLAAWRHGLGAADAAAGAGRGWRAWPAERFPAVEVPSA